MSVHVAIHQIARLVVIKDFAQARKELMALQSAIKTKAVVLPAKKVAIIEQRLEGFSRRINRGAARKQMGFMIALRADPHAKAWFSAMTLTAQFIKRAGGLG